MTDLNCYSLSDARRATWFTWELPTGRHFRNSRKGRPTLHRVPTAATVTHSAPTARDGSKERATSTFSQRDWASGYSNHKAQPNGYWIDVKGKLPQELTGTYYRNGPGTYKLGEQELAHPFDGHGFILSIAIKDGKAFARTRFVETPEYNSEVGQQKILFRGSFGTQKPGGARSNAFDIFMKNAANTNVIHWRGRLLALFESAQPVAMDPYSLRTLGPDLLGGSVKAGASFDFGPANGMAESFFKAVGVAGYKHGGEYRLGGEAVTAHPRFDPDTGRWVFFKFQTQASLDPLRSVRSLVSGESPMTGVVTFFELDQDMKEVGRVEHRTSGYTFLHDFALTPTHYVLMVCPVALDPALFLLGVESAAASVKWQEGTPSEVHLLGRPVIDVPAGQGANNQQQQQQQHAGSGHSNGAGKHSTHQEAVKPSAHQQQQHSVKQQQQGGLSQKRHLPEHLVTQVSAGFVFHHANSYYDASTDCMVVVCSRMDRFPAFDKQAAEGGRTFVKLDMAAQPASRLWRYDVNMTDGTHTECCLGERMLDFPSVHPAFLGRKARYTYGGAAMHPTNCAPIQCVAKHDMQTGTMQLWSKGPRYFLGEPQFIPRKESLDPFVQLVHAAPSSNGNGSGSTQPLSVKSAGTSPAEVSPSVEIKEDAGWVLAVGFDAETQQSEVVVLDASDIEAGPIATLPLRTPVGYGLHGTWVPSYYGP